MRTLLDLNVWIDIGGRPEEFPASRALFRKLLNRSGDICFPLCGYTTVHYILQGIAGPRSALSFLESVGTEGVVLLPFTDADVALSYQLGFPDHEDACIAATAFNNDANVIVTRDTKGFRRSPVRTVSVEAMLRELGD